MRIIALMFVCLMLLSFAESRLTAVKKPETVAHKVRAIPPDFQLSTKNYCRMSPVKASATHKKMNLAEKH